MSFDINLSFRADVLSVLSVSSTPRSSFGDEESGFLRDHRVTRSSSDLSDDLLASVSFDSQEIVITDPSSHVVKPVSPDEMGFLAGVSKFVSNFFKWLFSDPTVEDMMYSIGGALEDNEKTIIPTGEDSFIVVFREGNEVYALRLNSEDESVFREEGNIREWSEIREEGDYFERAILLRSIELFDGSYDAVNIDIENGWMAPLYGKDQLQVDEGELESL